MQHLLWSRTGARQGDPLGSLLFCLAASTVFSQIVAAAPAATGFAIVDDATVATPPTAEAVEAVLKAARCEGDRVGLALKAPKCFALWPHSAPLPDGVAAALREAGVDLVEGRVTTLLGAPIGGDPDALSAAALAVAESHAPFFERLVSPHLSVQEAMTLLRVCGVPKLGYLLRCARPSVTRAAAERFDALADDALWRLLGIDAASELSPSVRQQAALPISRGGLGIFRATTTATPAWLAAQAQAARHLHEAGLAATERRVAESTQARDAFIRSFAEGGTSRADAAKLLPAPADASDLAAFVAEPDAAVRLQHRLTALQHDRDFRALLPPAGQRDRERDRARLLAVSAQGAGTWLHAIPTHPHARLDDQSFRVAARLRLGLAPDQFMPAHCRPCGVAAGCLRSDPWHALSCVHLRSSAHTHRHDLVVKLLSKWIVRLGGTCVIEPHRLERPPDGSKRRPDLDVTLADKRYLVDVTVRHPAAPSRAYRGARGSLEVAAEAEREKTEYHRAATAAARGAQFVPFAVETFGGLGRQAAEFVKTVSAQMAQLAYTWAPREVVAGLPTAVAVAIQRFNTRACLACLSSAD